MTDQECITKLRDGTWDQTVVRGPNPTGFCSDETPFVQETADRIEQLAATCEELEMGLDRQAVRLRAAFAVVVKRVTQEGDEALAKLTECEARLSKAVEALVAEREANLWNAYNIGIERDGRWSDACMSDAEWLVAQCGLDPEFKDHDANVIKETIPTAARAVLAELEGK